MSNSPAQKVIDCCQWSKSLLVSIILKMVSVGKCVNRAGQRHDRRENLITASWDSPVLRIRAFR